MLRISITITIQPTFKKTNTPNRSTQVIHLILQLIRLRPHLHSLIPLIPPRLHVLHHLHHLPRQFLPAVIQQGRTSSQMLLHPLPQLPQRAFHLPQRRALRKRLLRHLERQRLFGFGRDMLLCGIVEILKARELIANLLIQIVRFRLHISTKKP